MWHIFWKCTALTDPKTNKYSVWIIILDQSLTNPTMSWVLWSFCDLRSMELVYQRPLVSRGIPVFRYVAPKTLFANGSDYPPNEGFCPCRQSGLLNVSSCRHSENIWHFFMCFWLHLDSGDLYRERFFLDLDSPVFISHPHFYNADPDLLNSVYGLSPNEVDHGLFIDIHPVRKPKKYDCHRV